jgi:hypothetical protein
MKPCTLVCALLPMLFIISVAGIQPTTLAPTAQQKRAGETRDQSRSTGSITGHVITDQGQPLGNAAVYVRPINASSASGGPHTTTDDTGHFQVTGLAVGVYSIRVSRPGYIADPAQRERNYYRIDDTAEIRMLRGGVITGTVTNSMGEPVIAVRVRALRVPDSQGRPTGTGQMNEGITDDRGVYRIYGLESGWYAVVAGGGGQESPVSAYDDNVPTYHPSGTRDMATLVFAQNGEEASGIDIRCRDGRGRAVSGRISGAFPSGSNDRTTTVTLTRAGSGEMEATLTAWFRGGLGAFGFYGVPDGEYEVMAHAGLGTEEGALSQPRRVIVKGSDVTGVELTLARLGAISGRLMLEAAREPERRIECGDKLGTSPEEIVIIARRDEKDERVDSIRSILLSATSGVPNEKGEFVINSLLTGRYRVEAQLPNDDWYVKTITLPVTPRSAQGRATAGSATDVARNGVTVKSGERVGELTVMLAPGAASLQGRAISDLKGASFLASLRVHLVPSEREFADDALRFAETSVEVDGIFVFKNIPPGRYWLLAKSHYGTQSGEKDYRPIAWNSDGRAALRREAEAAKVAIELQPCQRVGGYKLLYEPLASR